MPAFLQRRVICLFAALALSGLGAHPCLADAICTAPTPASAPVITLSVSCDEGAISRYFLLSPALAALSPAQRTAAISEPVRYAFIYMSADAVNRLHAAFADHAVQTVKLTETLIGRTTSGKPEAHEMFRVMAARADVAGIDWATLSPPDLFKIVPSRLSPLLIAALHQKP